MRRPHKLVIIPSRVDNLETYQKIFSNSFSSAFLLSPPVMYSPKAHEFFCKEFFVMASDAEVRDNFKTFGYSISELANEEKTKILTNKHEILKKKVSGSILEKFRALRNSTPNSEVKHAANEEKEPAAEKRVTSSVPFFLRR
jgi:hypothetical protein